MYSGLATAAIPRALGSIMKKNNSVREVDDQHHRLVKAIINGDAEQAERCMSEHMDTIERYMEEMQKES